MAKRRKNDDEDDETDTRRSRRHRGIVFWILFAVVIVLYASRQFH